MELTSLDCGRKKSINSIEVLAKVKVSTYGIVLAWLAVLVPFD